MKKIIEFIKKLFCKLGFCCCHNKIELENTELLDEDPTGLEDEFDD